jgi:hypothetical protein
MSEHGAYVAVHTLQVPLVNTMPYLRRAGHEQDQPQLPRVARFWKERPQKVGQFALDYGRYLAAMFGV